MRLIALVSLLPLLILAILLAILQLPLPTAPGAVGNDVRERIALVLAPILFIAYLVVVMWNIAAVLDQPGAALDREMARSGLIGRRSGVFGRSYRGDLRGYPVHIDFQPASGIRWHLLNLYVSVPIGHQAAIGVARPNLDCQGCAEVRYSERGMAALRVFADDEEWIRCALAGESVATALAGLVRVDRKGETNEVYIQPQRLWLRAHTQSPDIDAAAWIPMLLALARAVAPAPLCSSPCEPAQVPAAAHGCSAEESTGP